MLRQLIMERAILGTMIDGARAKAIRRGDKILNFSPAEERLCVQYRKVTDAAQHLTGYRL